MNDQPRHEHSGPSTPANSPGFEARAFLPFPVVGIGASAGGVEALDEFFEGTGDHTGMAFIVVQHLSPEHESMMAEILSRRTSMPVVQITDGISVKPDHVYVIAPGFTLTLEHGKLLLGEPVERRGHRRPVDDFFRSLAQEQKEKAIAVILSRTGTNGTAGAQAIKAAGGICIAQDPESAAFPGMPRSLIHAGYADQVLEPRAIARVIERYARTPYIGTDIDARAAEDELKRDHAHLREIMALLRVRTLHDFSGYRKPTLLRRIQRRMGLADLDTLADYAVLLRERTAESEALANDLMINVTGFFRDPEAWEDLRTAVIAPLVASREDGQGIRAWVTACASGEEAYTVAMILCEELKAQNRANLPIKIFATDTADKSLALARSGVYPGGIEGDIAPNRLERFFDKDEHTYRVKKEIRDLVVFAPQDILRDPPFSRVDLCTCRNLLIYLEPETQQRVMALLHFSLRDGGYLFLGNTESAAATQFEVVSKKWRIYRRIGATQHRFGDLPPFAVRGSEEFAPVEATLQRAPRPSATLVVQRLLLERYGPPTLVVDRSDQVCYYHGESHRYVQMPPGEPTRDLFVLVKPTLRLAVRTALRSALGSNQPTRAQAHLTLDDGATQAVDIEVVPLVHGSGPAEFFAVGFRTAATAAAGSPQASVIETPTAPAGTAERDGSAEQINALQHELQNTIEAFEATSEELKASNEEASSINEELQSSNEELQSVNEELTTVNAQLSNKITQLESTSNDLANLLSSTDIAVVFLDQEFKVRQFTPAVRDLLDLIDSDVGRPLTDLAMKFKDDRLLADAKQVMERLVPIEREIQSDSGRWYLRRALPYRTNENRIDGVVLTFFDVGGRKTAEQQLQVSEQRLQAVLEQMPMAVVIAEVPSGALTTNRQAAAMFERAERAPAASVEEMITSIDLRHGSGKRYAYEEWPLARAFMTGERVTAEVGQFVTAGGERRTISMAAAPVRNAQGQIIAVVNTLTDITRRVTIEQQAMEAENRIRMFLESAVDIAIVLLDTGGRVTHWNKGAQTLFGWSSEEALGKPIDFIFVPEDRALGAPEREMKQARQSGRAADDCWLLCNNGERVWVSGIMGGLAIDGAPQGFIKFMRDATAYKRIQDELRATTASAERAQADATSARNSQDEFLSVVSHELRTPLNTIKLWARLFKSPGLKTEDRDEGLRMVERAAAAQEKLIGDLLDVSRITTGQLRLARQDVRLINILHDAVEAVRPTGEARGIAIHSAISPAIGITQADPDRLQQVVWNLLSNAVKFTPSGGRVELKAQRQGSTVQITVTDTGIGIRADFLPYIFDRFTQAEVGSARAHTGLGLGLAIARQLVELHGGTLEVASEGTGKGATFTVSLPLPERQWSAPEEAAKTDNDAMLPGLDVLLVEDEVSARQTVSRLLEEQGATVRAVESAAAAREALSIRWPDVIISDIGLPGEDGYSMLRSIRTLPGHPGEGALRCVALTAFVGRQDRQTALDAGYDEYLSKPLDAERLFALLREGRAGR